MGPLLDAVTVRCAMQARGEKESLTAALEEAQQALNEVVDDEILCSHFMLIPYVLPFIMCSHVTSASRWRMLMQSLQMPSVSSRYVHPLLDACAAAVVNV